MSCIQAISLTETKDVFDVLQSVATIAAMIIGGIWTYRKFIKQRHHYPRINLKMSVESIPVSETHNLIHVAILHENKGETLLQSKNAELHLRQVLPLPIEIEAEVKKDNNQSAPYPYVEWPMLQCKNWNFTGENSFEIEPEESDSLHADFFIENTVKAIQLYYYISNIKKHEKTIGWSDSVYFKFPEK
jgi:hypothetical protein